MTQLLIISTSLDPASRSRLLARRARTTLAGLGGDPQWLDVQGLELPLCDGHMAWEHADTHRVKSAVEAADGIIIALGIYNYSAPASTKTIIEFAGRAFTDKVVGFCCASGGDRSYMSVMGLANALMLDFRAVIVPRFVYAVGDDFAEDEISSPAIRERVDALAGEVLRMTDALRGDPTTIR